MSNLVRLHRSKLTPEQAAGILALAWPADAQLASVTFGFTDGTGFRLSADVARELREYLFKMAHQVANGSPAMGVAKEAV